MELIVTAAVGFACVCSYVVAKCAIAINARRRAQYLKTGDLVKGRRYFVFGPRVRAPRYVPGSDIPVDDCTPWLVADLRESMRDPEVYPTGKRFVPYDHIAQVREIIDREHHKLEPLRRELRSLEDERAEIDSAILALQRELGPYEELAQRAEHLKAVARDAEALLESTVSAASDAAEMIVDIVGADSEAARVAEEREAARRSEALAGFDVERAVARWLGRESDSSDGEASEQSST